MIEIVRDRQTLNSDEIVTNISFNKAQISLNNNGVVAFRGDILRTTDGEQFNGLFRGDGSGVPTEIARQGQQVPAGDATLIDFDEFALNNAGQIAFTSSLDYDGDGFSDGDQGLFIFDDTKGIVEIAREGDLVNGVEIEWLSFLGIGRSSRSVYSNNRDGLNDQGQVAFSFGVGVLGTTHGIAIVNTDGTTNNLNLDFGDAPDSYGTALTSRGARHLATGPMLGSQRDSDVEGLPTTNADGDDSDNVNDEDGISAASSILASNSSATTASFSVTASEAGFLDAWIDFNQDGAFNGVFEGIYESVAVSAGINILQFEVPEDTPVGDTFGRFRISSFGGLSPRGRAPDGEVEDYLLTIEGGATAGTVAIHQGLAGTIRAELEPGTDDVIVWSGVATSITAVMFRAAGSAIDQIDVIGTSSDDEVNIANLRSAFSGQVNYDGGEGDDTLRLTGESQTLDLSLARVRNVETNDITGSGSNSLTLDANDVIDLSPIEDTLRVRHDDDDMVDYGDGWSVEIPQIVDGQYVHVLTQGVATVQVVNETPFRNPFLAFDTDRNGIVSPLDALVMINRLNSGSAGPLSTPTSVDGLTKFFYVDANGDRSLTPNDVLQVINRLNSEAGNGEGEAIAVQLDPAFLNSGNNSRITSNTTQEKIQTSRDDPKEADFSVSRFTPDVALQRGLSRRDVSFAVGTEEKDLLAAIDEVFGNIGEEMLEPTSY